MAVENIVLNLIPTGDTPTIHAAQFDVDRPFTVTLKEGEDDFTPTGYTIELQVRKVDNNIVTAVPTQTSGNVVTFNTTEQMTACSGTNLAELELTKDSQVFATLHFYLVVQRDVLAGGLTSQSEIYDLEEQIAAIVPEVIGDEYYTAEEVDEKIAEIPTFDPTNYYTKSQLYTKTETNGLLSAKANTSALSTVAFSGSYNDLLNKPTIPDVSNYYTKSETYNQTEVNNLLSTKADTSSLSTVATTGSYNDLLNKPTIPAAQVQSDWSQSDNTKVDYIKNKPTIPAAQVQSDWSQSDNTKVDYIKNKPTVYAYGDQLPMSSTDPDKVANRITALESRNNIKVYTTSAYQLNTLTWTLSASGKYYTVVSLTGSLPSDSVIVGITICGFGSLRATDILQPMINGTVDRSIAIMSNVNTFVGDSSTLTLKVLYI